MASASNSPARLIIRIVLGLVLAGVLVLGLMDYRAKSNATKTAQAWQEAIDAEFFESGLDGHIQGSPKVRNEGEGFTQTRHYTWPGIIRSYRVEVKLTGTANTDRLVASVEGPIND